MAVVQGQITPSVAFNQTAVGGFLNGQTLNIPLAVQAAFKNGTAIDQIDLIGVKAFSFSGTTMQTVDLTAMADVYGNAVNFARVKIFALVMLSQTDGQTLTLAPDASNGWSTGFVATSSSIPLQAASSPTNPAGAFFILCAPNATGYVVSGTHKVLDFTPSATMNAALIVGGCSV